MQCELFLSEPPVIDAFQFPDRKQGDRISVTCVVSSGDLPLNITWYKDDQPITDEQGINIQVSVKKVQYT